MPPVRSVILEILGRSPGARAELGWVNAEADKIEKRNPTLHIGADTTKAKTPLDKLRLDVAALADRLHTIRLDVADSAAHAKLARMGLEIAALQRLGERPLISTTRLAQADVQVLKLGASFDALAKKQTAALLGQLPNNATKGGGGGGGFGGRGMLLGNLGGQASLFGGVASASAGHILVDTLAEIAAVAIPATVAVLAFGSSLAATGPVLTMMWQREKAMYIATDLLGQSMPGLKTNADKLASSLKPGVFQVWGDGLNIVNQNFGTFQKMSAVAVAWVDRFAARVTVDIGKSTGTFHTLVTSGVKDLNLLGNIFGSIGSMLGRLFQVSQTTHIAEDLLKIIGMVGRLANSFLKVTPTWALVTLVALHGLYLWGGLAATQIFKLVGVFGKLVSVIPGLSGVGAVLKDLPGTLDRVAAKGLSAGSGLGFTVKGMRGVATDAEGATVKTGFFKTALATLGQVPIWGWVALGAVALGGLVYWLSRVQDSTQKWITTLNQGLASASNDTVFNKMVSDLGKVNTATVQSAKAADQAAQANQRAGLASLKYGRAVSGPEVRKAIVDQSALAAETTTLTKRMSGFSAGVGWIMTTFKVGYPEALAIANQAGVKLGNGIIGMSKSAQDARAQILGLMAGFLQLQTPAGIAGKDFEALAFASNDITQKISQLNSAWSTWTGTVTGSQTAFDTFAQGMTVLNSDGTAYTLTLGKLRLKQAETKAGVDSLSDSGVALNQAFMAQAGNLDKLIGSLRSANASQKDQNLTIRAGITLMLPFAKGSQEATSVLYALAQQANYTGNNSFKSLSEWAGMKTPAALKIMKKAANDTTTAASDLARTISNLLNVQFENQVLAASGASGALKRYTTDLVNNRERTRQGQSDRANLIADLKKAGLSADQARAYVDGLSTSIGHIPKKTNPVVLMTGTGKYTIAGITALTGGTSSGLPNTLSGHAAGWRVPGYGGGDKHPAYLEGGEAVVPKHLVAPIAPFLGANGVPGFSSGTYVGSIPGLNNFTVGMWNSFQNQMTLAMVNALKGGITQAQTQAGGLSRQVPNVGAGVARWAPFVSQALKMEGLNPGLILQVLYQIMTESGGNPNAINLTDINAQHGDASRGLLQTIMSTFLHYHWPGTSFNIYDPFANIAAALHYATVNYGPTLMRGGMGLGSGHGYANGGWVNEPVVGMGLRSGQGYSFAENEPELVSPLSHVSAGARSTGSTGGGDIYITVQAGDCVDPNAVAKAIHEKLRRYKTKKGGAPLGLN